MNPATLFSTRHTCLLTSILALSLFFVQPAHAIDCTWEPLLVTAQGNGTLVLRVADDQGAEKIIKLCSINTNATGPKSPEVCSAHDTSALAAFALDGELRIGLTDSAFGVWGSWNGTCVDVPGNTNLETAVWFFTLQSQHI